VVVGDLPGQGFEALSEVTKLHEELAEIVRRETNLAKILGELNPYVWEKYRGRKTFTCILARWQGEQMLYANAGHLPAIQVSKQERKQLPVTCGPVGAQPEAIFKEEVVPFPARDLIILYTDGLYQKLTNERDQGVAEIEKYADKFNGAEINTLCHRIFDCAQPGMEPNADDSTIVVIRRQPSAASASVESRAGG
jgi:serine phosphatase RsbU (regulator of sigma subunit)